MTAERQSRNSANAARQTVCWQGWRLEVPNRWNPIKLEGTFEQGYMLLADLVRPRLAVRWSNARKATKDPERWAANAMVAEVGRLAADEAQPYAMPGKGWRCSTLYIEPEPPGRDVWVGFSDTSGRAVEVIHHAHRRERVMPEIVLPTLVDEADRPERRWSVLDLSCMTPAWMTLEKPLLYAGDLGLRFIGPQRQTLIIRQVAPADVALKRMPLQHWLRKQQLEEKKNYRPLKPLRALKRPKAAPADEQANAETEAAAEASQASAVQQEGLELGYEPVTLTTPDGRELSGFRGRLPRRRRFFFKYMIQKELTTYALHDRTRNRLVIVQGGGQGVDLEAAAASVGWAVL